MHLCILLNRNVFFTKNKFKHSFCYVIAEKPSISRGKRLEPFQSLALNAAHVGLFLDECSLRKAGNQTQKHTQKHTEKPRERRGREADSRTISGRIRGVSSRDRGSTEL